MSTHDNEDSAKLPPYVWLLLAMLIAELAIAIFLFTTLQEQPSDATHEHYDLRP